MKIKPEFLGADIYVAKYGHKVEVRESNIQLLLSLGINYIFEVEEKQNDKDRKKSK
jgi:hypothetical protein